MREITIIGAGFSGLVTAFYLSQAGWQVRVVERAERAGGMLHTLQTPHGLVETAANGLRNSARLEDLCETIGVPLAATQKESRARFIWRDAPRRWPLGVGESLRLGIGLLAYLGRWSPRAGDTIAGWGERVLGAGATYNMLAPALSGIYAGVPQRLSANLILRRTRAARKPRQSGTVAPPGGMQQLIDGLTNYLQQKRGVEFTFGQTAAARPGTPTVICANGPAVAVALESLAPQVAAQLQTIEMLPLITATCFYAPGAARWRGFGCLFPRGAGFRALGVLFNNYIFAGRGPAASETWILGGATDTAINELSDEALHALLAEEHARLHGTHDEVWATHITRWPQALPHYTLELETMLAQLPPLPREVALMGNYLGGLGLSKILERAALVPAYFDVG